MQASGDLLRRASRRRETLHLDPIVVKDRSTTHVGVTLGHRGVRIRGPGHSFRPEAFTSGRHTRARPITDPHCHPEPTSVVIDPRLVPRDPRESAFSLTAAAPLRIEQPIGRARVFKEAVDLRAERPARIRMPAVTAQRGCLPVLDGHDPATSVRAVQRAGAGDLAVNVHARRCRKSHTHFLCVESFSRRPCP